MVFCSVATCGTTALWGISWLIIPFHSPCATAHFESSKHRGREEHAASLPLSMGCRAAGFTQPSSDFSRNNQVSHICLWQCWQASGWFFIFYSIFLRMFLLLSMWSEGKQRQLFQEVTPAHRLITAPQPLQHPARGDVYDFPLNFLLLFALGCYEIQSQ